VYMCVCVCVCVSINALYLGVNIKLMCEYI
jgi:hypothetical protein